MIRISVLAALLAAVLRLPAAVPSPESYFGHPMGADRTVLDWDKVVGYYRALADASPCVRVEDLGRTNQGRPLLAVFVASPETLRDLGRYAGIQRRLADPRLTPEAESPELIAQGKAVVLVTCSIHATELGSTPAAIEFVYRLIAEDRPRFRTILENSLLILVPSLNPDGLDLVSAWYRRTLGTPFEGTAPPRLYHPYLGHDLNRDWYTLTQPETRLTVARLHNVWHPHVVHDLHEQSAPGARMFVPPWMDPIEPNIDPILVQETNALGMAIASDLTAAGKTGVLVNALYDFWGPARHYQSYHGGLRILTEAARADLASPLHISPDELDSPQPGYDPRRRSWNYLEPWPGGEWRLRDIVEYELIALESCLYHAALGREDLLRNFYRMGRRALEPRSPYAFTIPFRQDDPGAARRLLELLQRGQVEIERAPDKYVIRLQQPYGSYAKTLLEKQHYPDLHRPYDVTAHTLPLLMGVQVDTVDRPFAAELSAADRFAFTGPGPLAASDTDSWVNANQQRRIALYRSHIPRPDEGWTRWVLEQFGFAYTSVDNAAILSGDLSRFEVLVFPDQPAPEIVEGFKPSSMPPEFCGGLGLGAGKVLARFADRGGTLVFLNRASEFGVQALHLPVRDVVRGREYSAPGTILRARVDRRSPLALGLPDSISIWNEDSPVWEVKPGSGAAAVLRYPASDVLASGWLQGEKTIAGRAALVECRLGKGRAILFGLRPQFRGHSYQSMKLFFNSLVGRPFGQRTGLRPVLAGLTAPPLAESPPYRTAKAP